MATAREKILDEILRGDYSQKRSTDLSDLEISKILVALNEQLILNLRAEDFTASSDKLAEFVENHLDKDQSGKNILDVFEIVGKIAKEELHPSIDFTWYKRWDDFLHVGNFLTRPESYDFVEVLMRIEEELGLEISDKNASLLETIGHTVQYLWKEIRSEEISHSGGATPASVQPESS